MTKKDKNAAHILRFFFFWVLLCLLVFAVCEKVEKSYSKVFFAVKVKPLQSTNKYF